jgi:hypothetical protein
MQRVAVLHDLPGLVGCDKPPKVGAFRPDVYAIDAPVTRTIIGEAKTATDLETEHSGMQFAAFLTYLRLQPNPILIASVPWHAKATARSLLQVLSSRLDAGAVEIVVLDDVEAFN